MSMIMLMLLMTTCFFKKKTKLCQLLISPIHSCAIVTPGCSTSTGLECEKIWAMGAKGKNIPGDRSVEHDPPLSHNDSEIQ